MYNTYPYLLIKTRMVWWANGKILYIRCKQCEKIVLLNVMNQIWFKFYIQILHSKSSFTTVSVSVWKLLIFLVYIFSFPKNKIPKDHPSGRNSSKEQKVGSCVVLRTGRFCVFFSVINYLRIWLILNWYVILFWTV